MPDVKTQLKTYLDHVVERVEVDDLYVSTARAPESAGSTRDRWSPTPRWAFGLAAGLLIALVAVLTWISGSADQIDPAASVPPATTNPPASTSPPSGMMPSQEDFTWHETQLRGEPGLNPGSATGPGFLDLIVGDGESFVTTAGNVSDETWTSIDGETWTLQPHYVRVIHGAAGQFLGIYQNQTELVADDRLAISDDGASWEHVTPESGEAAHRFEEFRYEGLTVDEVLRLDLPEAWNPNVDRGRESPGNASHVGAVLKIDGKYVAYFYSTEETARVMGAVSEDGLTWETFQPADFLAEWLDIGNDRAMSDRHLSERLWSSTFASDGTTILALVGDRSGSTIYESSDGMTWSRVETRYLEAHPVDVFAFPIGSDRLVWGIAPLSDGWVISTWWPLTVEFSDAEWPLGESFALVFSKDGENWLPLDAAAFGEGSIWKPRVAGDTIFVHEDICCTDNMNRLIIGEHDG